MKANCYDCIYRREVPGSAHSACGHPATAGITSNPLVGLIAVMGRRSGVTSLPYNAAAETLQVRGVQRGIDRGWFIWPVNFDPVWLENCEGFAAKAEEAVHS